MKKALLLTVLVGTMATSAAFAASVPVTELAADENQIAIEYGFNNNVDASQDILDGSLKDTYGISLAHGVNDTDSIQFAYDHGKRTMGNEIFSPKDADSTDLEKTTHTITAKADTASLSYSHKLNKNVNLYGALDYIHASVQFNTKIEDLSSADARPTLEDPSKISKTGVGISLGLVGFLPVADHLTAYAKLGLGTVNKVSAQVGATYDFTHNVNASLYYAYDKYEMSQDYDFTKKGFHASLGFKF